MRERTFASALETPLFALQFTALSIRLADHDVLEIIPFIFPPVPNSLPFVVISRDACVCFTLPSERPTRDLADVASLDRVK